MKPNPTSMASHSIRGKRFGPGILALLVLALPLLITPSYLADTYRYSVEIAEHRAGISAPYWEFGHLLWRPFGNLGVSLFGGIFARWFGDSEVLAAGRFLIGANRFAGSAGAFFLAALLLKRLPVWPALIASAACLTTNAFLNYSQSGAPYVVGFTLTVLAAYFLAGSGRWRAEIAGCVYAVAICVWFPYAFVGLGVVACAWCWSPDGRRRQTVGEMLAALGLVTGVFYLLALWRTGLASPAEIKQWIAQSDNGWNQGITLVRAVTGVPRGWFDLGADTIILKRWYFGDPYNPASLSQVAGSISWKLAAFYTGMAGFSWGLWRQRTTAPEWGCIAAAGAAPLLGFALFVFEPSSAERFLPAFPFLFAGLAAVFTRGGAPAVLAAVLPLAMVAGNGLAMGGDAGERVEATAARLQAIPAASAQVMLLSLRDEIYQLANVAIFDRRLNDPRRPIMDLIEIGSERTPKWRQEFRRHTDKAWEEGREVWITDRVWAQRPEAQWLWVEGDDPSITWQEIPAFFSRLETDQRAGNGHDGFRRLARSEKNRALLASLNR